MIYQITKNNPQIYTTGAFLRPMKVKDDNGKEFWLWYVEAFEGGDSFNDGEVYNPPETASSLDELIVDTTAETLEELF